MLLLFLFRLWERLVVDFFDLKGKKYFIVVENYLRWIEVKVLLSELFGLVIKVLIEIFLIYGILDLLVFDDGL